jgi:hypothetical protein
MGEPVTTAELLRACAAGRLEYAENAPAETRQSLETEANALNNAAALVEGDLRVAYSLLPSWRWAEAGLDDPSAHV